MPDVQVESRSANTVVEFTVSAPYSGDGAAVDYSTASVSALLHNTDNDDVQGGSDVLYRVDSGDWVTLPPGRRQSVTIDFATQTLTMKRGQFAADVTVSMTATGVPAGLYAGETSLEAGGGSTSASDLTSGTLAAARLPADVYPLAPALAALGVYPGMELVGPIVIAYNNPAFATGITVTPMNVGDACLAAWMTVTDTFDASDDFTLYCDARNDEYYFDGAAMDPNSSTPGTKIALAKAIVPPSATTRITACKVAHTMVVAPATSGSPTQGLASLWVLIARNQG